jgi:hypothetical protein
LAPIYTKLGGTHVNEQESRGALVCRTAVLDFLPERTITAGRVGGIERSLVWCDTGGRAYDALLRIEEMVDSIWSQYSTLHGHGYHGTHRYICVVESPRVRLTLQGQSLVKTSKGVSQMFVNSSKRYGTVAVSAELARNVTSLLPESIMDPSVGHAVYVRGCDEGTNESCGRPAASKMAPMDAAD